MSEDIRASALLDQLTEIDLREMEVRKGHMSWRQRFFYIGLIALPSRVPDLIDDA